MFTSDLSYDPGDPAVALPGGIGTIALQIFTTSNVYGLPAGGLDIGTTSEGLTVVADELSWAGQQQRARGSARLAVERAGSGVSIKAAATHSEPIKALKFVLRDLPAAEAGFWQATSRPDTRRKVLPLDPLLWRYPWPADDPWPEWETPWAAAGPGDDGTFVTLSVRDDRVRPVRLFAHRPPWATGVVVEVVCELDAREWSPAGETPQLVVQVHRSQDGALASLEEHLAHAARAHGMPRWEERTDVPGWFHSTRLVITLHGGHWTGYVFNTFDQMGEAVRFVAERIDGRKVLAYIPGWEGRYYFDYPHYQPAPLLGGPAGFDRLLATAHSYGVRVMPMFGIHGVNAQRYPDWEQSALRTRTNRMPLVLVDKPDWDGDRSGDDDQVFCNPGEPGFRQLLVDQISELAERHAIDGAFLDTTGCWFNDPRYNLMDGYRSLTDELRRRHPGLLIAGEGWFDALLSVFPVNQTWHDPSARFRCPDVMSRFARALPHLSTPAPGRGSTGVHENGWGSPPQPGAPMAPGTLRNISFVDDTLRDYASHVELLLAEVDQL